MIISKYNKSYDTADGSEQHYEDRRQPNAGEVDAGDDRRRIGGEPGAPPASEGKRDIETAGAAGDRWEDDGGPLRVLPPISPSEFSAKPNWSVLSLRDVSLAVRLGDWPDNPARLRQRASEAERAKVAARESEVQRAASRAYAERHLDRNPWEHT